LSASQFSRLVRPREFGALLDPPVTARTVYRWINQRDGLPVIELPGGRRRIDVESAWTYLRRREYQVSPRRQGRRASGSKALE
jgi:hypothetical protein